MVLWVRNNMKLISSEIIQKIMAISTIIEGLVKMLIYCSHSSQLYL